MEKQEIKITDNLWPVIIKEDDEGNVEVSCPFFCNCTVESENRDSALEKIQGKITSKIEETRTVN